MTEPVLASASWQDARRAAYGAASVLPAERISIASAIGRVLADDVVALADVPHYRSSAMDGWAVAGEPPWRLVDTGRLADGLAIPIVTGGAIPTGADAVLQSEHGDKSESGLLEAKTVPVEGRHIRPAATEATRGEVVIAAGIRLNPVHIAVAAGCGHDAVDVVSAPRVAFVLTGDEVDESGVPPAGRVRDSFGPQLPTVVGLLGGNTVGSTRVGDTRQVLVDALGTADADVIITTGSTGDSTADHLRLALAAMGAELIIDGLAVRPGAPSLLARLRSGVFVVGLPGNPLAAMLTSFTLAQPLIAGLLGTGLPPLGSVVVGDDLRGVDGRTVLVPYRLVNRLAIPSRWRGSGMLRGLAEADGVLVTEGSGASTGDRVTAFGLPWVASMPS